MSALVSPSIRVRRGGDPVPHWGVDFEFELPPSSSPSRPWTVSELTRRVRAVLESQLGEVRVTGEVSNLRRQPSGHQYFTLKDDRAQLSCVLFRGAANQLGIPLQEGDSVEAAGELSVYEPRGVYQLVVRTVRGIGMGALQARFEALKRKLDAEGLFDPAHKRDLPAFPRTVALVTSPGGAAVRDLLNVLRRRAPWLRILVFPARVQGKGAADEIVAALKTVGDAAAGRLPGIPAPDVAVVGRGGGSIEDLWCFNEERVARAVRACPVPVVSAVGHEIDFTITDFAADLRAPTPSAAAELVAPDGADLARHLGSLGARLDRHTRTVIGHLGRIVSLTATGALAREPRRVLAEYQQTVDALESSLADRPLRRLQQDRHALRELAHQLERHRPERVLQERRFVLNALAERLARCTHERSRTLQHRIGHLGALLHALGPEAVFSRGFSMTLTSDGHPVRRAADLATGTQIRTRFAEGSALSTVEAIEPPSSPAK